MDDAVRSEIDKKQTFPGFIKTSDKPVSQLSSEQKAHLNRQGNVFFNEGNVDGAKRIFIATGYSDGLTRIGDYYFGQHKELDALKFYLLAHNMRKAEPLIQKAAELISMMIKE
ncbi:MAG: hypothetical protein Pg6C_14430 [Treponemataceae bacterium]|nr:MAG: hypothetical protein Pg6C_14430 [Treponemataceae bacterium]